jgi:NAD(P)H dehydrogenase (quinone)
MNKSKILIAGATGQIGRKTVEHLLKTIPANRIVVLARDAAKAEDFATRGIEVRVGDYFDYGSLLKAYEGIGKVLLIGSHGFTDRFTQHYNAITAARQAGVEHVIYTSIMRKAGSGLIFPEITESDVFSEQTLKASGLAYTILFHPPFSEVLQFYYGFTPYEKGILLPEGSGKMSPVTRDELAEAQAVILATPGHENKTYLLSGSEAISFLDIANTLADIKGESVPYKNISGKEYVDMRIAEGIPAHIAGFVLDWVNAINSGEYEGESTDIEQLINRKTSSFRTYLESIPA